MREILMQSGYTIVNNNVTEKLGLSVSYMLSQLISRYDYFVKFGMIQQNDWFYVTVDDIERSTGLSKFQQKRAISELESAGLIEFRITKKPYKKREFHFSEKNNENLFFLCDNQSNNYTVQSNNLTETSQKTLHKSNNINNKTDNDLIPDATEKFFEKIDIEEIEANNSEFSDILKKAVSRIVKNKKMKIGNKILNINEIFRKFLKLNCCDVISVMKSVFKKQNSVRDVVAYTITSLYNYTPYKNKKSFSLKKKNRSYDLKAIEKLAVNAHELEEAGLVEYDIDSVNSEKIQNIKSEKTDSEIEVAQKQNDFKLRYRYDDVSTYPEKLLILITKYSSQLSDLIFGGSRKKAIEFLNKNIPDWETEEEYSFYFKRMVRDFYA